jgi:RNA polymerase sigma-70 factor, ECF subfamily
MAASGNWHPERYRDLLCVLVRQIQLDPRLGRRFDTSDVVQETLLKATQNLEQFHGTTEAELVQWLQEIMHNALADEMRKARAQKRDVALEQSLEAVVSDSSARLHEWLAAPNSSPSQRAQREEQLLRVSGALAQLPQEQRDAVILRDSLDTPVREIAKQLGRTEKAVAGLLRRGRHKLRALLQDSS